MARNPLGASPQIHRTTIRSNVNSKTRHLARLTVIDLHAAGIDIDSHFHVVAAPSELDDEPVQQLTGFTQDLKLPAEWLVLIGITTGAMESTGIDSVPLHKILAAKCIGS